MSGQGSRKGLGGAGAEIDDLLGGDGVANKRRAAAQSQAVFGEAAKGATRLSAGRFTLVCAAFSAVMLAALVRFADMAAQREAEPEPARAAGFVDAEKAADLAKDTDGAPIRALRAPIIDRNGAPLARDVATYELYLDSEAFAFPEELREAATSLADEFPGKFDADALIKDFKKRRTTLLSRRMTAWEAQRAHDLGVPGLYLTPRFDRYYPAGAVAAHLVGAVSADGVGTAGIEAAMDQDLQRFAQEPLRLSIDLRIQRAARAALAQKAREMSALSASAVVMSVKTGEVLALVSLPDYNPHDPPAQPQSVSEQESSPLFHRAVAGRYELGSVMKIFAYATALEEGVAAMDDVFAPLPPLVYGDHEIPWDTGPQNVSLPSAFARSVNRVAAELALRAGRGAQARMFEALGLTAASPIELGEAPLGAPEQKAAWREVDTAVASYGYGVEMTPLHLAAALASLANGGERVSPTLLHRASNRPPEGRRVVSAETSRRVRDLLRLAVTDGTGKRADVPGLAIGGKTGTARKLGPKGYDKDRTRTSFAAVAPYDDPELAVVVMLDEPSIEVGGELKRSAGYTAAPAAGAIFEAIAPLAGIAPRQEDIAAEPEAAKLLRKPARSQEVLPPLATGSIPGSTSGAGGAYGVPTEVTMGGIY